MTSILIYGFLFLLTIGLTTMLLWAALEDGKTADFRQHESIPIRR